MLFKLSSRNVKRSIKDYTVYFLTLALGICIFYIFNSLDSQTVMMDISDSKKEYVDLLSRVISIVSVLVSFILGFLVIYANNFIIKKRNKEFGIYMTLGISKNKISTMLFMETIIIGILSLVAGIFAGVFLSQGLAGLTAKMFDSEMTKYTFVFSKEACTKTIFYFSLMFIVVMCFNFIVVYRCKLIDLINGERTNQKLKGTNLVLSVILFILSIVLLAIAYKLILENKLFDMTTKKFHTSIMFGIIGTILFFRALAGFLIKLTQNSKKYYLKGLNTFILRQLNSKINTHYISMSIICLMLFVAIGMSSTGLGMKKSLEESVKFQTPYDMTMSELIDNNNIDKSITEELKENEFNVSKYIKEKVEYHIYFSDVKVKELFKNTNDEFLKEELDSMINFDIPIIKISDYNKLMKMKNHEPIELKEDEVVLLTDMSPMMDGIEDHIDNNDNIKINKRNLKLNRDYEYNAIETAPLSSNGLTFIIDDRHAKGLTPYKEYLSFNYTGDKIETENEIVGEINELENNKNKDSNGLLISAMSKQLAYEFNMATANLFLYVGIYLGIVFLIASAAVLALSQLSQAIESKERYKVLNKLGVSKEMINKSIAIQVLIYFALPISLALVHSIFGIEVANDLVKMFGDYDMIKNNVFTIGAILIVYSIYFVATYNGYKKIINNQ